MALFYPERCLFCVLPILGLNPQLCGLMNSTNNIPALSFTSVRSNLPGVRRLWLIDRREVVTVLDPRRLATLTDGWLLGPGGLQLAETATVHAWQFRAGQGTYTETAQTSAQGDSYRQLLVLTLPGDVPMTTLAVQRMAGREWVGVMEDVQGQRRILGTERQPLRFSSSLTAAPNRTLTFLADTLLPAPFLNDKDIFSTDADFSYGFSYDFYS